MERRHSALSIHGISRPCTGSVLDALEEDIGGRASKGQAMRFRGFALVELSLVVGLAAIAGVGVWMAFGPTSAGTRIQLETVSLIQLADAIAADYAVAEGRYQSVNSASAIERKLAPSVWVDGQGLHSRTLGNIELSPLVEGQGFRITATAVQAELCPGRAELCQGAL